MFLIDEGVFMPPKAKFDEKTVAAAAVSVIRRDGFENLTARSLAAHLGSSPRPIFTLFDSMEKVSESAAAMAVNEYLKFSRKEAEDASCEPYKARALAYIKFASVESELFRFLFMRPDCGDIMALALSDIDDIQAFVEGGTGVPNRRAMQFHIEFWLFVHGMASVIVTSKPDWRQGAVESMLTDAFEGLRSRFLGPGR